MAGKLGKLLTTINTKQLVGQLPVSSLVHALDVNVVNKSGSECVVKVYLADSDDAAQVSTVDQIDELTISANGVGGRTCKVASPGEYVWVECSHAGAVVRVDFVDRVA